MNINSCNELELAYRHLVGSMVIESTPLSDFGHQLEDGLNKHICSEGRFVELDTQIVGLARDYDFYTSRDGVASSSGITPDSRAYLDAQWKDAQSPFARLREIGKKVEREDDGAFLSLLTAGMLLVVTGIASSFCFLFSMTSPSLTRPFYLGFPSYYSGSQKLVA